MQRRKNIFASIDIGPDEIRLVIGRKGFKGLKSIVNESYSIDDLASLSHKLAKYRPKEVILVLPQERVITRDLVLPPVDKSRIKSMLYYQLSGVLPYSMEQVQLDYLVLSKTRKEIKVKAFVIPERLSREVGLLRKEGIQINRLIPRGLAVTAYLKHHGNTDRLVKVWTPQGQLVLYPDYKNYFCRSYDPGTSIDQAELKGLLTEQGIEPIRWDLMDVNNPDLALFGAIYFYLNNPKFNLLPEAKKSLSTGLLKFGVALVLILILAANGGTFYLRFTMKRAELATYQERLEILLPRMEKVRNLRTEVEQVQTNFEKLETLYNNNRDYLIWLRELHILLQEDTEVNILVFEDQRLRELHGKAPSATKVSGRLADSIYFSSPEFTSPITPREENGKMIEEFTLTAVLRYPQEKEAREND